MKFRSHAAPCSISSASRLSLAGCGAGRRLGRATLCAAFVIVAAASALPANADKGAETVEFSIADDLFAQPYIDVDEWRDAPVRHRYIHGGFKGTDTRFSFYLPPTESYKHRFFQYITPVPDSETVSQGRTGEEDSIGMALASGAIFVETNGGGPAAAAMGVGQDQTIGAYRANAASAQFARFMAGKIYGAHRTYGFAYGGSGGAYRTIGSIENTTGVWDGVVPYVIGSPMAIPNMFTVRLHAMRVVGEKLDDVVDAVDPGGSGDPYATLDPQQAAALREVTRMGFDPRSWYAWRTMGPHAFALLFGGIRMVDPAFFNDFWTRPGYEGHDRPELYTDARVQLETTVAEVITASQADRLGIDYGRQPGQAKGTADNAWQALGLASSGDMPVAFRLAKAPPKAWLMLSDLVLSSGEKLNLRDVAGDIVIAGIADPRLIASVKAGDSVRLDNSDILAVQTYHRHQVPPGGDYPQWDQFRDKEGEPLYPQRPMLLGPMFARNAVGSLPSGKFQGKMIVVESLWDREALPWQADWYRKQVKAQLGDELDGSFRVWFTDHALHGDHARQDDPTRIVSYLGELHQALRDLAAWVQDGTEPPQSTQYEVVDGQVVVPATAQARKGIQPVVQLTVNGTDKVEVAAGGVVTFKGTITAPPGTGSIVGAEWDFGGKGEFPLSAKVPAGKASVTVATTHRFDKPGTYFAVLRGISQRDGDADTPFARLGNLARVRVVVR